MRPRSWVLKAGSVVVRASGPSPRGEVVGKQTLGPHPTHNERGEPLYPENLGTFLEGIKTDFETVGASIFSGASLFSSAFSFFSTQEEEARKVSQAPIPRSSKSGGNSNNSRKAARELTLDEKVAMARQNDAMAMRLPSMWHQKASMEVAVKVAERERENSKEYKDGRERWGEAKGKSTSNLASSGAKGGGRGDIRWAYGQATL